MRFANQMGIQLFETSAKENINVEEMFRAITNLVLNSKKAQRETLGRDLYIAKDQKLFQNQNSKWINFAMAFILNLVSTTDNYITMYEFNHILQFSTPIWSSISKWMLGNVTFFTFLLKCS